MEMVAFADNSTPPEEVGRASLLLVEDEPPVMDLLVRILSKEYEVYTAKDCQEAEALLESEAIDVIICDHGLPGESGLDFLTRMREAHPYLQRILLTGHRDLDLAIRAINEGDVHRYLPKPAEFSTVCEAISSGLERRERMLAEKRTVEENAALRRSMRSLPYVFRRLRYLSMEGGRFMVRAMGIYLLGSVGFFICGVGFVVALYVIKTIAGVDLLHLNLEQIVGRFHQWAMNIGRL